jgi:hypothetical protein
MNDQVRNLVQIRKSLKRGKAGNLAENQAFLEFLAIQKQLESEFEATWSVIRERMEQYDIKSVKGSWGHITMAERQNFSGSASPRFMKKVLDSSKLKAYMKLHKNQLPEGVKVSTTRYLSKKITLGA